MAKSHLKLALLALFLPLAGCGQIVGRMLGYENMPSYRFRVTVQVMTPEGIRSGSSVLQVDSVRSPGWVPAGYSVGRSVSGDAVTIHLGKRGTLFMTLHEDWGQETMKQFIHGQYLDPKTDGRDIERIEVERVLALKGRHALVRALRQYHDGSCDAYNPDGSCDTYAGPDPGFLVTFSNLARPETGQEVTAGHLDRVFGKGVFLKRVVVEITNDPVTRTITNALPWVVDANAVSHVPPLVSGYQFVHGVRVTYRSQTVLRLSDFRRTSEL